MDHNKDIFDGMFLFYKIVEHQNLSAAARAMGHTPSHVSKELARLEERLGTRLLNRTTRRISLTESGQTYFENSRRIVEDTRAVENRLSALGNRPYGELRMSVPVIFAHGCFNAWVPEFLVLYPEITLNLDISERRADLISEGFDLLVRIGKLPPSDLVARELFQTEGVTVASPAYLAKYGTPQHPNDLRDHDLIDFSFGGPQQYWTYPGSDQNPIAVSVRSRVCCNDAQTEKSLVLAGIGITRLPKLACQEELASGMLISLLSEFKSLPAPVNIIYASRTNLAAKTRAMIDFLVEKSQ